MADFQNSSNSKIRFYRHPTGSPPMRYFEESTCAATAVIRRGDIVSFDTVVGTASARILRAPSSGGTGTNLLQVGILSLVGVATGDSTSDGGIVGLAANGAKPGEARKIGVYVADEDTEFLGWLSSGGAGPAVSNLSLIGTNKAVVYSRAEHNFFIDSTNSTAALVAVRITDIPSEHVGDTNGPVIFKFLSSNCALGV